MIPCVIHFPARHHVHLQPRRTPQRHECQRIRLTYSHAVAEQAERIEITARRIIVVGLCQILVQKQHRVRLTPRRYAPARHRLPRRLRLMQGSHNLIQGIVPEPPRRLQLLSRHAVDRGNAQHVPCRVIGVGQAAIHVKQLRCSVHHLREHAPQRFAGQAGGAQINLRPAVAQSVRQQSAGDRFRRLSGRAGVGGTHSRAGRRSQTDQHAQTEKRDNPQGCSRAFAFSCSGFFDVFRPAQDRSSAPAQSGEQSRQKFRKSCERHGFVPGGAHAGRGDAVGGAERIEYGFLHRFGGGAEGAVQHLLP